jgi:ElaB/YqjD/DUF883 family membrane-anchored ribosome-binding protein
MISFQKYRWTGTYAAQSLDTMATNSNPFPASQRDISQLKETAADAVCDLTSTAAAHASKAKGHLRELAEHVRSEGGESFDQLKDKFGTVAATAVEYISERPLTCVGVALAVGFLVGLSRRRRSRS